MGYVGACPGAGGLVFDAETQRRGVSLFGMCGLWRCGSMAILEAKCSKMGLGSFGRAGIRGLAGCAGRCRADEGTRLGWGEPVAREGDVSIRGWAFDAETRRRGDFSFGMCGLWRCGSVEVRVARVEILRVLAESGRWVRGATCSKMGLGSFCRAGMGGVALCAGRCLAGGGTRLAWGEPVAREGDVSIRDTGATTTIHHRDAEIRVS